MKLQSPILQHTFMKHDFTYPQLMFCDTKQRVVLHIHGLLGHSTQLQSVSPTLKSPNFLKHGFTEHGVFREQNTHVQGRVTINSEIFTITFAMSWFKEGEVRPV